MGSATKMETTMVINKDFLEKIFSTPVREFSVKPGTSLGDNYASIMYSVTVNFVYWGEELNLLVKTLPNHPGRKAFFEETGWFAREYFIYSELIPEILKVVNNDAKRFNISTPTFYAGNVPNVTTIFTGTPWEKDTFIVLEDLRKTDPSYTITDRQKGLDFDHAKLVVEELANIHALSWIYKQKHNITYLNEKYPLLKDLQYADEETAKKLAGYSLPFVIQSHTMAVDLTEKTLGKDHPATKGLKKLLEKDTVKDKLLMFLNKKGAKEEEIEKLLRVKTVRDNGWPKEPWMVFTHADPWSNNFLYQHHENGKPVDLKLIDFQLCREGCPTADLNYMFHASLNTETRKKYEKVLLQIYFDKFSEICKIMDSPLLPGLTLETLQKRYRRTKVLGVLYGIPGVCFFLLPPENVTDCEKKDKNEDFNQIMSHSLSVQSKILKEQLVGFAMSLYEDGVI